MKASKVMPTDGQFAAVWEYKGNLWSDTFKWVDGRLMRFMNSDDEFSDPYSPLLSPLKFDSAVFITDNESESKIEARPVAFIVTEVAPLLKYLKNPRKYREEYEESTGYTPIDEHSWDAWLRGRIVSMLESIEKKKVFDLSGDD